MCGSRNRRLENALPRVTDSPAGIVRIPTHATAVMNFDRRVAHHFEMPARHGERESPSIFLTRIVPRLAVLVALQMIPVFVAEGIAFPRRAKPRMVAGRWITSGNSSISLAMTPIVSRRPSRLDEGDQILVDHVLVRRAQAVRGALVDLQLRALDDLRGQQGGVRDGDNLIVVAVQDLL